MILNISRKTQFLLDLAINQIVGNINGFGQNVSWKNDIIFSFVYSVSFLIL